jgi:hypothetical protein
VIPVSQDPPSEDLPSGDPNRVDDPYASLFRPEEPPTKSPQTSPPRTPSETGRVFKSQGVSGHEEALLAVPNQKSTKLRTLARDSQQRTDIIAIDSVTSRGEVVSEIALDVPAQTQRNPARSPRTRHRETSRAQSSGRAHLINTLSATWVYVITVAVTVVFALGNVFLFDSQPGALTGIGLMGATIFVSFAVRPADDIYAIFAPAIAFFIVAVTVGQINFSGSGIVNRSIEVFFILGQNWIWIIGSTVIALTIVALRRRSLR